MNTFNNYNTEDLPNEIWKAIAGYEGYFVSNLGRVKSYNHNSVRNHKVVYRILHQSKNPKGYYSVVLFRDFKRRRSVVARLVAEAFLDNPLNLPQVDHIDTDKSNNCVSNLRWVSPSGNRLNPISNAKFKKAMKGRDTWEENGKVHPKGTDNPTSKAVIRLDPHTGEIEKYDYLAIVPVQSNGKYKVCSVGRCCRKIKASYKGQLFFFENDPDIKSYLPKE